MASALEDTQPDWLRYAADTVNLPVDIANPPRDEYIPDPNRRYVTESDIQRGRLEDLGIYGNPKPPPAGDVVIHPEREIPNINVEHGTVWPDPGKRAYRDLQEQFGTGSIQDKEALKSFYNNPNYEGMVSPGLAEQLEQGGPSYLRKLSTPSALEPDNILTQASYAGDVLSPYATGNARLGQPSSVENVKDEFARRIQTMVGDMPPDISQKFRIQSGVRSPEWNAEVYRRRGEVAPRTSRHSFGMAVDTTSDPDVLNWINSTNGKYGVDYTLRHLPNEQNHLEMVENGVRAPLSSGNAPSPAPTTSAEPAQPPSAAAADRTQVATDTPSQLHPVFAYEKALEQFPVLHQQQLISGPGKQLEYWPPNEPGTPDRPRPDYIPIDQAGMELGPNSTPMDILGDVVSHHMVKKDPVIKKHYESFQESLTPTQKELLQAQYMYYTKNEGETRPYAQWEKSAGLPAYFRGYAFGQWPADFNQKAYTPAQRYHFDRMMDYLRGNQHQSPPSALQ